MGNAIHSIRNHSPQLEYQYSGHNTCANGQYVVIDCPIEHSPNTNTKTWLPPPILVKDSAPFGFLNCTSSLSCTSVADLPYTFGFDSRLCWLTTCATHAPSAGCSPSRATSPPPSDARSRCLEFLSNNCRTLSLFSSCQSSTKSRSESSKSG